MLLKVGTSFGQCQDKPTRQRRRAVCYIFGSLGPIIITGWFLPTVMKWIIR
jgi:hypothetical protein